MSNKLNPKSILLISRDHLCFYGAGSEEVVDLPLSTEIVNDLEIISQKSLVRVVQSWLEQYKIVPQQSVLLLDDSVLFHQKLDTLPDPADNEAEKKFLSIIPFRNVLLKTFPMKDGAYILAINQGFLRPVIEAFEQVGFSIVSVSPAFIFGINLSEKKLNKDLGQRMLGSLELLLQYNFLSQEEVEAKLTAPQTFLSVNFDKKLIMLIIVFIVLIGILVVLLTMEGVI